MPVEAGDRSWIGNCAVWSKVLLPPEPPAGWEVFPIDAASVSGGGSTNTITLTVPAVPAGAVVLVMASCGLNAANSTSAAISGMTLDTLGTFDNTTPNPDRLTRLFRGIAGGSIGSTLTITFPGNTSERMAAAIYITGAPTTNNGADAIQQTASTNAVGAAAPANPTFSTTPTGSVLSFTWTGADSSGTQVTAVGGATIVEFSPSGISTYAVAAHQFPPATDPVVHNWNGRSGGQIIAIELTGELD